ncbi:MAG: ferredoxin [Bacillota bacterium]
MKAYVNDSCIGCGFCIQICPDVFFEKADGKSRASTELVPADAEIMVIEAKTNCPATAIETTGD